MKSVPYAPIRLVAGIVAAIWSVWQVVNGASVLAGVAGLIAFGAGWLVARRFAAPIGLGNSRPWLDTALPIALAAFAIAPAALYPLIGEVSFAATAAVFVLFFAGVSLSLGSGPYANVKVALAR